jgi:hypothetical protein
MNNHAIGHAVKPVREGMEAATERKNLNHYSVSFDKGYLVPGLALWRSLQRHDPQAMLWVLAGDEVTADVMRRLGGPRVSVVELSLVEEEDAELVRVKSERTRAEYFFTLAPCWPRWLLLNRPEIDRITKLDSDILFFSNPARMFTSMDGAGASIMLTPHGFPSWAGHYKRHGIFNAGCVSFRNDETGRACVADWRERCIEWCYDRLEPGRAGDQAYLDAWPSRYGTAVHILDDAGVNLAPWNWETRGCTRHKGVIEAGGLPVIFYHFAAFRALRGDRFWQSGQMDYGVMTWRLRQAFYGTYWRALKKARTELFDEPRIGPLARRSVRVDRAFWRALPLRILFGTDWVRIGDTFISGRLGLGRYSGRVLAKLRTILLRR